MSALLQLPTTSWSSNTEYGVQCRKFESVFRKPQKKDIETCLFLVYQQFPKIPHRKEQFRNHFTLFRKDRKVLICRTSTTRRYYDTDIRPHYEEITVSENVADRLVGTVLNWSFSFDTITHVKHTSIDITGYEVIACGEWWYFDQGTILLGETCFSPTEPISSQLVYYECHGAPSAPENNSTNSFSGNVKLPVIPSVKIQLPAIPSLDNAEKSKKSKSKYKDNPLFALPSAFWFESRQQELIKLDITYFQPKHQNYCLFF